MEQEPLGDILAQFGIPPVPPPVGTHRQQPQMPQPQVQILQPEDLLQPQPQLFGAVPQAHAMPAANVAKEPKAKAEEKKKEEKVVAVEAVYEGYTIRPLSPAVGSKKSWAYCTSNIMYLDDAKLLSMAKEHISKTNKDAQTTYRGLSAEQQALVDRVVARKRATETSPTVTWEAYDIRRVRKDVRKSFFTVESQTVALELIIRRKDLITGNVTDKPKGTTTNPAHINGQVLDLSVPLEDYLKSLKKAPAAPKKAEPKPAPVPQPPTAPVGQNPDPALFYWNGHKYEKKSAERIAQERRQGEARLRQQLHQQQAHHDEQLRRQHEALQNQFAQDQQREREARQQQEDAARLKQQEDHVAHMQRRAAEQAEHAAWERRHYRPQAPMPPESNPFWPNGAHPSQYPPVIDHGEALDYDTRARPTRRHRSRSRPRSHSRRRSRHRGDSFGSSDEDSYYDESTPPSSPPRSIGSLNRRRHKSSREERFRVIEVEVPRRPRGSIDDYPSAPQRRLTAYAQGLEAAQFARNRLRRRSFSDGRYDGIWERERERR